MIMNSPDTGDIGPPLSDDDEEEEDDDDGDEEEEDFFDAVDVDEFNVCLPRAKKTHKYVICYSTTSNCNIVPNMFSAVKPHF